MGSGMMTDTQLYLAPGLATLAVLTSLTISLIPISCIRGEASEQRRDMADLRKDFGGLRRDGNGSLNEMRREMREDRKEAREDRLQIAAGIRLLTGEVYESMGHKQ
jgi:hypothetical protein